MIGSVRSAVLAKVSFQSCDNLEITEIKPQVYWVGAIDWNLRNFHGYLTPKGSTYNAYLIIDEKVVLVDTVKSHLFDEMLARIREIVDPEKIDYVITNHVEMDHSGSLQKIMEIAKNATAISSTRGEKALKRHYQITWKYQPVKSGEEIRIGKRTMKFIHLPMVHWPDSMGVYIPEEKLFLPNDAFGQHMATSERFDDQVGWDILKEEAGKYYANIVLPYGDQARKAIESVAGLEIDMIAPSHGLIWRTHLSKIIEEYNKWTNNESENVALIVYDSMWGSTEKMACKLKEGLEEKGIKTRLRNLSTTHISTVVADVLFSKAILIGSPTFNNGMLPTVGGFLTYITGLRPKKRIGFAFGSFGWGGQASGQIEKVLSELDWELPFEKIKINYIPNDDELNNVKETGHKIGEYLLEKN